MSKGNKCPIDSSSSNDFKNSHYQYRLHHPASPQNKTENPLSHICKYLDISENPKSSKDNVELALEVEINESLKHVLTSPERNSSELLDVTIIRPSDSDTTHETTVALNKEEVRDFISLVEQHHRHQLNEPHYPEKTRDNHSRNENDNNEETRRDRPSKFRPHKALQNENRTKKHGDYEEEPRDRKNQERSAKMDENPKHVYATINTFDKLKHSLPCQNKHRDNDKPGTPCMCQHCGVVGVLVQSQKGPVAPFPPLEDQVSTQPQRNAPRPREPSPVRKEARQRRMVDIRKKKSLDQLQLLREINTRIKSLEKRISVQEETAVPRDYLKHILHKVLLQYNLKATAAAVAEGKLKNNSTQYSSKNIADPGMSSSQRHSASPDRKDVKNKYYQVHTALKDHANWLECPNEKEDTLKRVTETLGLQKSTKDHCWFWGEEVVKPGCDLKNKILKLLDDKLYKTPPECRRNVSPPRKAETAPHAYPNRPETLNQRGIRIEKDEKTIFLDNVDHINNSKNYNYMQQGTQQPPNNVPKNVDTEYNKPAQEPALPTNANKFSAYRNFLPKPNYPFDVKKTLDDTTFKKNIEAQKEKNKEKIPPAVEEKFYNAYACHSITTESQASMDYIIQKLRNNAKILESGLTREKEAQIEAKFKIPNAAEVPGSLIKENFNRGGFRVKKEGSPTSGSVDVKFVNPKIRQWSEESSTSDDRLVRHKVNMMNERKERVALEKKESLIYKLDFLKNLAKNKSTDQSRVLNKIWNQAKNTAKSKKDAVYIKIPFKNLNTREGQDNLIEMHLTLEELETVVKSAKVSSSGVNVKVQSYKSSSDIDLGQRKHEEIKHANRELLKRRQLTAKANKHKDRR